MSLYSFMNKEEYKDRHWQLRNKKIHAHCLTKYGDFNKTAHLAKKNLANTKFIGGE